MNSLNMKYSYPSIIVDDTVDGCEIHHQNDGFFNPKWDVYHRSTAGIFHRAKEEIPVQVFPG